MALLVERAGPVCWAVEPSPDGIGFRKRLLLGQDPPPLSALHTALTEGAADRWIEQHVSEEQLRAEAKAHQAGLFDATPTPAEVGEEGAAKALAAASSAWRESAWRWLLARHLGAKLTSDDLTEAVGIPPDILMPSAESSRTLPRLATSRRAVTTSRAAARAAGARRSPSGFARSGCESAPLRHQRLGWRR